MRRILVVSDNPRLTGFFKEIINQDKFVEGADISIDFAYSKKNRHPEPMVDLGCTPIDMHEKSTINRVLENYDLIFSLHCKQIFPPEVVSRVRCVNLHPGLNPHNRGWYPQVFSIINKKPCGATLHFMDEKVDHGGIISQEEVAINSWDTSLDVYERIFCAEKKILSENISKIIQGSAVGKNPYMEGNYNSIADYKEICKLNLDHKATLGEHIDLLRALSHGDFMNAHYTDSSGNKVFIRVELFKANP